MLVSSRPWRYAPPTTRMTTIVLLTKFECYLSIDIRIRYVRSMILSDEFPDTHFFCGLLGLYKRRRLVSFEHRLRMCQLAFNNIPGVVVSDAEYQSWVFAVKDEPPDKRGTLSVGTASLLEYFHQTEPDAAFTFCMGADAFMDLTSGKWKESDRVLQLVHSLLVMERKQQQQQQPYNVDKIQNASNALRQRIKETSTPTRLWQVDQLDTVSSSQVRACTDKNELKRLVLPAVLEYMEEHGLYQFALESAASNKHMS